MMALASAALGANASEATSLKAEPFRLVWSSSAGCGNPRSFLSELERRTALLREAEADEHAITLIVETFRGAGGVRGQLTVRKPDGDLTVREVPGQDCSEVESAMALIAALMVDPLAGSPERARPQRSQHPTASPPSSSTSAEASPWSLRVEPRLTTRNAVAPSWTWGQALGLMLTRESGSIHPSLGLSAHLARTTATAAAGSAELEWAAAQLTLCPAGFQPAESWDLRACATLQLGRLRGSGFETAAPASKAILWSSAGAELQGRYQLLGPLWLGLESTFSLPFTRERFYLAPNQTLHEVPWWELGFGVGLGLRFF